MRGPYNEQVSLALWGQRDYSRPHVGLKGGRWLYPRGSLGNRLQEESVTAQWWGPSDVHMVTADLALLHANGGSYRGVRWCGRDGVWQAHAVCWVLRTSWLRTCGTPPE